MNDLILALNEFEPIVFIVSTALSLFSLFVWYKMILFSWPIGRGKLAKFVLSLLPAAAFLVIFSTLRTLASHDVINNPFYILFYLAVGFAWLYLGVIIMSSFFDLSWVDDI